MATDGEYLERALAEGTTPNGVFTLKVMWNTLESTLFRLRRLSGDHASSDDVVLAAAFSGPRYVWLRRIDELAQAVSWAKAAQTGQWAAHFAPSAEPEFDRRQVDDLLHLVRFHNGQWQRWFGHHRIEPLRLTYEELVADNVGTTRSVLAHAGLELPPGVTIEPPAELAKQADEVNDEWIARYRARS